MRKQIFFLTLGFWALLCVAHPVFMVVWLVCGTVFFWILFRQKRCLILWIFLCLSSVLLYPQPIGTPVPGVYTVTEIKKDYVLAKKAGHTVLLYDLPEAVFDDQFEIKDFDEIHSLNNSDLFSFESYMRQQQVAYQGNTNLQNRIAQGHSLRAQLFYSIRSRDTFLTECLYGIDQEDSPAVLQQLSLPLISLILWVERVSKRYMSTRASRILSLFLILGCGYLFVFTIALVRMACQRFSRLFFDHWEERFVCTTIFFLLLVPQHALSFAFVVPTLFSLLYGLCHQQPSRSVCSKIILFGMQFLYFQKVDLISILCFSILRKWSGFLVLTGLVSLWFPLDDLRKFCFTLLDAIPSLSWEYEAGMIFFLIWSFAFFIWLKETGWLGKGVSLFCVCLAPLVLPYADPFFRVTVFSIGNGDCTLITEPFHRSAVLIDCGQNLYRDNMEKIVIPYLRKKHIDSLDAVIITHDDFDHSGGLDSLQKVIPVKVVISQSNQKVPVDYPFYLLLKKRDASNENDKSILSYFSYDRKTYLWMGDASIDVESQLLHKHPNLKADVLKLGHHGSKTSSSMDFLYTVKPSLSVISSGYKNRYGHPDVEVLRRLQDGNISSLNTASVGMIEIFSFHGFCFFRTGNGLVGLIP